MVCTCTPLDVCFRCQFDAIPRYTPSVNIKELLRSGTSFHSVPRAVLLNDIANLEQERREVEALFIKVRDRLINKIRTSKTLPARIRCLSRETLLEIFDPYGPFRFDDDRSSWRILTRSLSLSTNLRLSESCIDHFTFPPKHISLTHDLPVPLSSDERPRKELSKGLLQDVSIPSARWSGLKTSPRWMSELLSCRSFPAANLTGLHINLAGPFELTYRKAVLDILPLSPPREVQLEVVSGSKRKGHLSRPLRGLRVSHDRHQRPGDLRLVFILSFTPGHSLTMVVRVVLYTLSCP
ncbi:hypothetical protein EV421DRAFT_2034374 [Armillaria borealis]|uniref:Uncharacterized protein n=1 Tax=Armillaria borealis TaxID=47425 RepID=A0AA39MTS3_9AGAR|nr:hypothetical protein EV421DRAFT_2034374 [Armillaria borealis]